MGQYRQWLYYRENKRRLQNELMQREQELAQLQAQAARLQRSLSLEDNAIIRALTEHATEAQKQSAPASYPSAREVTSPSLQAVAVGSTPQGSTPEKPYFAEQQTAPQVALPWWIRNLASTDMPIDQQSDRVNRLVERWAQRWHRQSEQSQDKREN